MNRTSLRAAVGEGETSLATGPFLVQHPVFQFDLRQHKQTSDDWIEAFQRAVAKRTRGLLWPAFVGLSSGYDSGAIHLALILANVSHQTFTIMGYEDRHLLQLREEYGKGNLHTGIQITEDSRTRHMEWLAENVESFEYVHPSHGQNVHSDAASLGLSHILERCRGLGVKVYFSGSGADETISDYAVNGTACCKGENGVLTSNFNGTFPQDLSSIFPWGNFYSGQMKNYLMKEENVGGSYGMETRYPFLDRELVQEYISLSADFKNSRYKRPIRDFFHKHDYPFREEKLGFGVETEVSSQAPRLNLGTCIGCCSRPSDVASSELRVAIVSAFFKGAHGAKVPDALKMTPSGLGIPMFLFTDANISDVPWQIIQTPYHISAYQTFPWLDARGRNSRANVTPVVASIMAAKFYKMNAHLLPELAPYDVIVWADSNYSPRRSMDDFRSVLLARLGGADILVAHHHRWSVRDELLHAARRAASNTDQQNTTYAADVQEAYDHQVREGFVDAHGLYFASFFVYRAREPRVRSALRAWWQEVQLYTFRDQISFPFVASKFDMCVATGSYFDVVCAVLGRPQYDERGPDVCNHLGGILPRPPPAKGTLPKAAIWVTVVTLLVFVYAFVSSRCARFCSGKSVKSL